MYCENDPSLFDHDSNFTWQFLSTINRFQAVYAPVHGYICIVLCVFGVVTNLIHVVVLTRPSMRTSAVNCLMIAVAVCDLGTMGSYLVYICNFVLQKSPNSCSNHLTFAWILFLLFHMLLSITLHTTTLWLAVAMAFLRRMTINSTTLNSRWQKARLAKKISLSVLTVVFLLSIPTFMVHQIIVWPDGEWVAPSQCKSLYANNYTETVYTLTVADGALRNGCFIYKINLWLTGILFKVIPCLLLIVLTFSLIVKLRLTENKRRQLLLNGGMGNDTNKRILSDRTTALLVAILIVFVITELPQGVLVTLNAIYTTDVHKYIYLTLGDLLDLLSLINSSVNFVLYCIMSSRYRHTFCALLLPISFCGITPDENANGGINNMYTYSEFANRIRNLADDVPDIREILGRRRSSPGYRLARDTSATRLSCSKPPIRKISENYL